VDRGRGYEERQPILEKAGFKSVEHLPKRVQKCRHPPKTAIGFCSKACNLKDLPPQLRLTATSNGEQRVRVLVPNEKSLHRTTQFLVQEYLNLVDWKGLELSSIEKRCKASVKKFERSSTAWADWIELKEEFSRSFKRREARRSQSDDKRSTDIISDIKSREEAEIRRKPSGVLLQKVGLR